MIPLGILAAATPGASGGGGGGSDPYFASVVSGLHFDGDFTDVTGRVWTPGGSAAISSADAKFGSGAGEFLLSSYIYTDDSEDFYLDGDFTQELWVKPAAIGTRQFLCGQGDSGASDLRSMFEITTGGSIKYWASTSVTLESAAGVVAADSYYHLEVSRASGTYRLFVNGNLEATRVEGATPSNFAGAFYIGRCGLFGSLTANAYLDDFRLTKGVARHTDSFIPPPQSFPNS